MTYKAKMNSDQREAQVSVAMKLTGPDRYDLIFDTEKNNRCIVRCSQGKPHFSGLSTQNVAKIYIVSRKKRPIYVGVTVQPMGERLRGGFTATGQNGYHGYAWRRMFKDAVLDVFCPSTDTGSITSMDAETIEAEIVFLIRQSGQWPACQTEIHFHESTEVHRRISREIMGHYQAAPNLLDTLTA